MAGVPGDSWYNPWALGAWPELPGTTGQHLGHSFKVLSVQGQLVDTTGPQPYHKSAGRGGHPRGTWDPSPSRPVELVDPRAIGPWPNEPGTAGENHGPSEKGASHPGQLVDPMGTRTRARVTRDN